MDNEEDEGGDDDDDDDSDDDRKKKKKKKREKRKHESEDEEDDDLDDDDLDLMEENLGVRINREKKMKRVKQVCAPFRLSLQLPLHPLPALYPSSSHSSSVYSPPQYPLLANSIIIIISP